MSTKRKNFTFNTELDADIYEWFESLPPKRHSYFIREAIKFYIKNESDVFQQEVLERLESIENNIKNVNDNDDVKENDEENNELVDAEDFVKNTFR